MENHLRSLSVLLVLSALVSLSSGQNDTNVCAQTSWGKVTYKKCEERLNTFVGGDLNTVFEGTNKMLWPVKNNETALKDLCRVYEGAIDVDYMVRSELSPTGEQYLNKGFHKMMDFLLCGDGRKDYLLAKYCLNKDNLQSGIQKCFDSFQNYTVQYVYVAFEGSDRLAHEHCDVFKVYQQCRIDIFKKECSEELAEWNNEAIIKYYAKYMDNVHCDIDGGITTKGIVFIVLGCMGGMIVLFCMCFCCSRFMHCTSGREADVTSYFKKLSKETNTQNKKEKKEKEKQKDEETGKAKTPEKNGYYNTKELDNNSANEKEEERRSERNLKTIDERDEHRDRYDRGNPRYLPMDSPRNSPRDPPRYYPRDSPRGLPRHHRVDPPRVQPLGRKPSQSYDEMFNARVHGGPPPPRNMHDTRNMQKPRGLMRY